MKEGMTVGLDFTDCICCMLPWRHLGAVETKRRFVIKTTCELLQFSLQDH